MIWGLNYIPVATCRMPGCKLQEITGFKFLDRIMNTIWLWQEKNPTGLYKNSHN